MEIIELIPLSNEERIEITGGSASQSSNWVDILVEQIHKVRGIVDGFVFELIYQEGKRVSEAEYAVSVIAFK